MELLTLCRSCMVEVASWELQNFDGNAMEMFTFCTNIEVSNDDKLPKQFCCDCKIKIESSYTFIKKAQEINEILNTMLLSSESTVIVKSESLTNNLLYNESNSLDPASEFSFEFKIDKMNKKLSPNSNQSIEYKMEFDVYQNSPENSDDEPASNEVFDVPEIKFDSNIDELNNLADKIDGYVVQKSMMSKNHSNRTNNNKIHKKKKDVIKRRKGVPALEISNKRHNTRTRIRKSYEFKNIEKGNEKSNTEEKFFECDICKQRFKYKKVLQKHMINKHLKTKEKRDKDRPKVENKKAHNTYYPDVKTCDICDRTFKSSRWFSRHIKEHSDAKHKQYYCKYCPKTFYSRHAYDYHTGQHSESRRFACGECGARFKLGKQLAAHALTQAHEQPHVCTKCGEAFKTKKDLDSHMNSHLDERPFLCNTCGFSTKFSDTLNNHMLIHTGEKPYACTQCAFRTSAPSSMRVHARRHRGERPHACPHCDKRFVARGAMTRHIRQVHTRECPYQCYLCPQAFTDSWKCKLHIKKVHNIPIEEIPRFHKYRTPMKQTISQTA